MDAYVPLSIREKQQSIASQPLTYVLPTECKRRIVYVLGRAQFVAGALKEAAHELRLAHGHKPFVEFVSSAQINAGLLLVENSTFRDIIEVLCRKAHQPLGGEDTIGLINRLFAEFAVGYRFDPSMRILVKLDSDLTHKEIVAPVVPLLRSVGFAGAEDDFQKAIIAFRGGDNRGAITKANAAFESVMKTIATKKGWPCKDFTAKKLIALMLEKGIPPSYLESEINALRTILESGLPTIRNKEGAHGQGPEVVEVPEHRAWFALQLAAANIQLLVKSFEAI